MIAVALLLAQQLILPPAKTISQLAQDTKPSTQLASDWKPSTPQINMHIGPYQIIIRQDEPEHPKVIVRKRKP